MVLRCACALDMCNSQTSQDRQHQIVQLVEYLNKDLEGPRFESQSYFSHPVTLCSITNPGDDKLTPVRGNQELGMLIFKGKDHLRGQECDCQNCLILLIPN